ncbi:hypothetical protein NP493_789g01035 [Ridgeia piscesae]|uniref:Uncharacterized protein n=1 Tax=Ridgeia piscesae TaxID=27915 RepID=A0AAD9NLF6_RIDPI|nr:hypothetical protein NP493_789g01035 [Ridgeia piscesae]
MGCPCQTSTRFVVALFASFGLLISFGLRCNISVAVVQMTTNRTTVTPDGGNKTEPEFDWPPGVRAVVDSSFLYGYFVTQIPGGYLASRYPANR